MKITDRQPGLIALLGSGETSNAGGQVFEAVAKNLPNPPCVHVLETPAGFELNSEKVAGRILDYLKVRLQNYNPRFGLVHARGRETDFSTDSPTICAPILTSDLIYFGAGSPSYTVRQLENSLALDYIRARHRLGAALVLASAATISLGRFALPVYEIYKVGEEPHWKKGLDFLSAFGLSLVLIPHWNNSEGGSELDTSRCFIGRERFERLFGMLPENVTILGLDEHTGLIIDLKLLECRVIGKSKVHIITEAGELSYNDGQSFPITALGAFRSLDDLAEGISSDVWQLAQDMEFQKCQPAVQEEPPAEILALVTQRQAARAHKNWSQSDRLREEIAQLGWIIQDSPNGPILTKS